MWCCKFKSEEWIVSSLRKTQKGSIKATVDRFNYSSWKDAKNEGIRCVRVNITKADIN